MSMEKKSFNSNDKGKSTSNRRNRRTKKPYAKGKEKEEINETKRAGSNDPRWYGSPEYVSAVSSFNFASALGKPIGFRYYDDPNSGLTYRTATSAVDVVPGVMAVDFLPTPGIATTPIDPVNTYFQAFYTKLRSTNNQSAPYQFPDLGMFILAIDSLHMVIEQLVRVYGLARTYNAMNRYYPDAAIRACGVDPHSESYDLYKNLADFRASILLLISKTNMLNIPKGIPYNERHRDLVRYVYADGMTSKSQSYLFRTKYVYKFDWMYGETGSGLHALATPIGESAARWLALGNELADALRMDGGVFDINGDILKSFTYQGLYQFPSFDENYQVYPIWNPEILLEIHNSRAVGDRYDDTAFDVTQDPTVNVLKFTPYCGSTVAGLVGICPIIDMPVENPSPDEVMIATRLTSMGGIGKKSEGESGPAFKSVILTCGSELVNNYAIYTYTRDGDVDETVTTSYTGSTTTTIMHTLLKWSNFDWAPLRYYITQRDEGPDFHGVLGDLQNYTVLDIGNLRKMNDVALYGMYRADGVDNVGKFPGK